jgi:hypothetical protein
MSVKKINLAMYKEYLREAGCEVDEDFISEPNHVWFSDEGLNYLLSIDSADDGFVEISIPYELDGSPDISKRYEVCNHIARSYKLMKCFYTKDGFVISAEAFIRSSADFKSLLKYCMVSLHVAYNDVFEKFPDGV